MPFLASPASGSDHQVWSVTSPDHPQTFAYGSERHRQWLLLGSHLGMFLEFTNDPYVDKVEPRQYDDFTIEFPNVRLGKDGHTFYYHSPSGRPIAVAIRHPGFLGDEISLLPSSQLVIERLHGKLSLNLLVGNDSRLTGTDQPDDRPDIVDGH